MPHLFERLHDRRVTRSYSVHRQRPPGSRPPQTATTATAAAFRHDTRPAGLLARGPGITRRPALRSPITDRWALLRPSSAPLQQQQPPPQGLRSCSAAPAPVAARSWTYWQGSVARASQGHTWRKRSSEVSLARSLPPNALLVHAMHAALSSHADSGLPGEYRAQAARRGSHPRCRLSNRLTTAPTGAGAPDSESTWN